MINMDILHIGDISENGQITIIDEDRLCYLVKSDSKGATGIRTISKALLKEYINYFSSHPNASANDAREALSGTSEIDRFEYGYTSTLKMMAQMVLNQIGTTTTNQTAPILRRKETLPLQQIFYGAPGTGKSHTIKKITEVAPKENVFRTTFHPDSDYSTFVGAYKPTKEKSWHQNKRNISIEDLAKILNDYYTNTEIGKVDGIRKFCYDYCSYINGEYMKVNTKELAKLADISENYSCEIDKYISFCKFIPKQNSGKITYEFVPQSFTKAYVRAWQINEPVYLVIEEINRGNCAQIFGDLFQLLDRKDGFSEYPIKADNDLSRHLADQFLNNSREGIPENVKNGEELVLPNNLYIWATMNTSDQSLFPIDSAFKRRWDWKYVPIVQGYDEETGTLLDWNINVGSKTYNWWKFLQAINRQIGEVTQSEDKKLGYFFVKAKDGVINAETFVGKVIFYIWNDVFKDFADEAGSLFKDDNNSTLSFNDFYTVNRNGDAAVVEEKVEKLLKNLGVSVIEEEYEDNDDEDEEDEEDETDDQLGQNQKDRSGFSINGQGHYNKRKVPFKAVSLFVQNHPNLSAQEIADEWYSLELPIKKTVITSSEYTQRLNQTLNKDFPNTYHSLELNNGEKIYIYNKFSLRRINGFIEKVNSQDWGIHIERKE